ncbi:MAG: ABC transporter permease [Candidatus Moranbacteria bacterium RIFCSPLOWO2_02_FULL_48_19]|nr:MAG: ABC transporter permease [Candidatus Moranbacteria bacterium RIFCSPLOWO2_02_FULL_48_19]OGI31419.1 MAG: ABC transporter permease [Candidatus Moranbacteria bacterium RIFCSPLOWO2_12_FULL_48_12]
MTLREMWVAYMTIVRKESVRFLRIWPQTLLPSVVTTTLYYVVFGTFIGSQIKGFGDFSYIQFIVPGLVMMAVITNSFANVASSFFGSKFQKSIEELLVSPIKPFLVVAGYVTGGVFRGLLTGVLVLGVSLFFTHLTIHNWFLTVAFIFLTSLLFALAGLLNGIYAKDFDGVSIIPTFVLTPLTYLGGVFYSISALPPIWQTVSVWNPILYMVNGFRYGFLGVSDVSVPFSLFILIGLSAVLIFANIYLFKTGRGLRT